MFVKFAAANMRGVLRIGHVKNTATKVTHTVDGAILPTYALAQLIALKSSRAI